MAEENSVDFLKSVPQAFFDFVARMVPGAIALVVIEALYGGSWNRALETLSANRLSADNVFKLGLSLGMVASYAVGQLLTPAGKWVEHAVESIARRAYKGGSKNSNWPLATAREWQHYDWLRVHVPSAAGLVVRIRAEYSMFNILAATFLIATAVSVAQGRGPALALGLALSGAVMARRAWNVKKMFCLSVQNVYRAAHGPSGTSNSLQANQTLPRTSGPGTKDDSADS